MDKDNDGMKRWLDQDPTMRVAFNGIMECEPLERKLAEAVRDGTLQDMGRRSLLEQAIKKGVFSFDEAETLALNTEARESFMKVASGRGVAVDLYPIAGTVLYWNTEPPEKVDDRPEPHEWKWRP